MLHSHKGGAFDRRPASGDHYVYALAKARPSGLDRTLVMVGTSRQAA
ncbi:MAG TPA: hypothetical protein VGF11_06100 [Acidimicrobiales bacterium]